MKTFAVVFALILGFSGCHVAVVEPDVVPPAPPHGLYTETGDNFIEIFWQPNYESDLYGYRIYVSPTYQGPYELIGTARETYFNDTRARNGSLYYYAVSAVDIQGNESPLSEDVAYDIPRPEGYNQRIDNFRLYPRTSAYDFSQYQVLAYVDNAIDMFYDVYGGIPYMVVPEDTDIQDMGPTASLLDLRQAPSAGWSPTKDVVLYVGHTYVVWTYDDHYAKFRVTSLTPTTVTFDWAYQLVSGSPLLKRPAGPREPIQIRGHASNMQY